MRSVKRTLTAHKIRHLAASFSVVTLLSPLLAELRAALGGLPDCKALIKRFQSNAGALLAFQELLNGKV